MNHYTIDELTAPATYKNDSELYQFAAAWAGSAIQVIEKDLGRPLDRTEAIQLATSGRFAERIHKAWTRKLETSTAQADAQATARAAATTILAQITYPTGVSATIENNSIALVIPRDGGLMTPKAKRLDGYWDTDRKQFTLPLAAAKSLPRVIANWEREFAKVTAERQAQAQRDAQQRREREQAREAQRQAEYAAYERANAQRQAAEDARRAHARANRAKVVVGRYAVGDELNGRRIASFGQSWTATETRVPDKYWHGSLYEGCPICGHEPVEVETGVCERHHPHAVEVQTEYCYAYFA